MENPKRRKKTARFAEIAALAGVSVATVDRVLNERDRAPVQRGSWASRACCPTRATA